MKHTLPRHGVQWPTQVRMLMGWLAGLLMAATAAPAASTPRLLVWINSDKGYNGLQAVGNAFEQITDVPVQVQHPDGAPEKFVASAAAGRGPDIICWAHNAAGEWARSGLIVPLRPSRRVREEIDDTAWAAFTFSGRTWGYPLAIEAIGLLYNRALVNKPPASFEELITLDDQLARQGRRAVLWAYNQSFYTWPILAGAGGFIFGQDAHGALDTRRVGVDNAGALAGVQMVNRLIREGRMPSGARYSEVEAAFASGRVAMTISGPWAWDNARKSGIDFGVAPIPSLGGRPAVPFIGVLGCMVSAASKVQDIAREFIENHLLTVPSLKLIAADVPLGVPANKAYFRELAKDPKIAATMANARAGQPMPVAPEMARFFPAMDAALEATTGGRQSAADALRGAAARMLPSQPARAPRPAAPAAPAAPAPTPAP